MRIPFVLVVLVALSFELPVGAQVQEVDMPPSEVAARGHYLMGREHYQAARFAEAATEFQQAYDLSRRPALFFNIFLAQRDAGRTREAAAALRQYIENVPDAPQIEMLRGRLAVLEAQLREQDARGEGAPGATGPAADTAATPDASTTEVVASESRARAEEGEMGPWIVVGVGGALAVGAIVTGALVATTHGELSTSCPNTICPADYDVEGRRSAGRTLALATDVLGGLAAATLAAGLVWELIEVTGQPADESRAGVRCTPLGCRGRF